MFWQVSNKYKQISKKKKKIEVMFSIAPQSGVFAQVNVV